jgi:hypothetical protein
MGTMPVTHAEIVNAKPREKPYRLFDGRGLYLEIAPSGGRWWRFKYRFNGKEKRQSLGVYPGVSIKAARDRLDEARRKLASGIDPADERSGNGTTLTDGAPSDTFGRQLAHQEPNEIRAAYNYAKHLPERRRMMQAWADYLQGLKVNQEWRVAADAAAASRGVEPSNDGVYDMKQLPRLRR